MITFSFLANREIIWFPAYISRPGSKIVYELSSREDEPEERPKEEPQQPKVFEQEPVIPKEPEIKKSEHETGIDFKALKIEDYGLERGSLHFAVRIAFDKYCSCKPSDQGLLNQTMADVLRKNNADDDVRFKAVQQFYKLYNFL